MKKTGIHILSDFLHYYFEKMDSTHIFGLSIF